jgi:hypothetical protein
MAALLSTLDICTGLGTIAEIVRQAEGLGFTIRDRQRLEALTSARDLGLVDRQHNALTYDGKMLARLEMDKPELFADIVHGLQYTLWDQRQPEVNCFSWSYRALCRMLWHSGTTSMVSRRDMASEVEARARRAFSRPDIALSPKSMGGAMLWIAELDPPVLVENEEGFARRAFCSPELLMLGIDFVYRTAEVDYGSNLLLSDERQDEICQVGLLEPEGFNRVLEYAAAQFDYLETGLGGGWGQYLTLHRLPKLEDFV